MLLLKKKFRVKKTKDIEAILKKRQSVRSKYFIVYKKNQPNQENFRFAMSVPKKYGKAHERNKIKRQIRMIVAGCFIQQTDDFFIIVTPHAKPLTFQMIEEDLKKLLKKISIL